MIMTQEEILEAIGQWAMKKGLITYEQGANVDLVAQSDPQTGEVRFSANLDLVASKTRPDGQISVTRMGPS